MPDPLPYASPAPPPGRPVLVAVWIGIFGLAMMIISGLFLIGVLVVYENFTKNAQQPFLSNAVLKATSEWSLGLTIYVTVLYFCALVCLVTSITLLNISVKKLLKSA